MLIDHGTFEAYVPDLPTIATRPTRPEATPLLPVPEPTDDNAAEIAALNAENEAIAAANAAANLAFADADIAWLAATAAPRKRKLMLDSSALFARSAAGVDWYEIAHAGVTGNTFAMLSGGTVVAVDTDPSMLWPAGLQVIETDQPVAVGDVLSGGTLGPRVRTLSEARASRIAAAWAMCESRISGDAVSVTTSAGTHSYGIDALSQDNIKSVLLGVVLGVTPNPRPWTPRGVTAPVQLSHDDLKLIGATMMSAVDARMQAYLAHKAAIAGLGTVSAVDAYDLTAGWGS